MNVRQRGALYGLGAALTFGASAPLSKLLLPQTGPLLLAALLYLGAGLALTVYRAFTSRVAAREAPLRRQDFAMLAAIVLLGGAIAPAFMLIGLGRLSPIAGALLLNLEAPFTIAIAVTLFREHLGGKEVLAAALIVTGALLLAWGEGQIGGDVWGAIAIAGACACWGLDNNLSQRLSLRDPAVLVQIKGLGAGVPMLFAALVVEGSVPEPRVVLPALALGAVSYGLSIVLDTRALRLLGAAREAAFFATAPFAGALLAVLLFPALPSWAEVLAAGLMMFGVIAMLRARHGHLHTHQPLAHEHRHVHDEHHQHEHEGPVEEPHSHWHEHGALTHDHPHVSDAHHRHDHRD